MATPGATAESFETPIEHFDFAEHRRTAETEYRVIRPFHEQFSGIVRELLLSSLIERGVYFHSIESRAKDVESFGLKSARASAEDPEVPKYDLPLTQITDLSAARVITYFLSALPTADECIREEFDVLEVLDKRKNDPLDVQLGYQSVHYIVRLDERRRSLPEYSKFADLRAEVQVRTILQHAWAEIEHDIQYKAVDVLPVEIRRRFLALAGMLEIGDREFQAIADAHETLRTQVRERVETGDLDEVEITPDALKTFLDQKYGSDARLNEFSYAWTVRVLKQLGFATLDEVAEAIDGFDDDSISRLLWGIRQGQLTRFEDVLLASMGEVYLARHPWVDDPTAPWYTRNVRKRLKRLKDFGIATGEYDPRALPSRTGVASLEQE